MPLKLGTPLGHYEILELIGQGGMGVVYRAKDKKLGRDVAIKVLSEELARDRERLDRLEREARLLARLNHAHIATLYGLEEHGGQRFLVMELVEGETLAERISRGPIPLDEAIPLFIQIAEGLEAAHEKGIIHRDLKPANIKIGPNGEIKILDFGLAKAAEAAPDASDEADSHSPTRLRQGFGAAGPRGQGFGEAGTELGVILGTASYMSPEQARGKSVDKKTDIWAFGCCVYEALTGKKAFAGETVTDILAAVVKTEPDWPAMPAGAAPTVTKLVRRATPGFERNPVNAASWSSRSGPVSSSALSSEASSTRRKPIPRSRAFRSPSTRTSFCPPDRMALLSRCRRTAGVWSFRRGGSRTAVYFGVI